MRVILFFLVVVFVQSLSASIIPSIPFPDRITVAHDVRNEPWDDNDGPGPDGDRYFEFFPLFKATIWPNSKATWDSPCLSSNTGLLQSNASSFLVSVQSDEKQGGLLCSDLYLFATRQSWHVVRIREKGEQQVSFGDWLPLEKEYVEQYGVQVFLIQGGWLGFFEDLAKTWQLLFTNMEDQDSLQLLQDYMNVTLKPRDLPETTIIPSPDEVQSGDILFFFKFGPPNGGLNTMEALGTGGLTDHTAMILEIDGELTVTESLNTNANYEGSPGGIIKTKYTDWMENLRVNQTSWLVNLMRLSEPLQKQFSQKEAEAFAKSVLGNPYGFRNYIFGWIDVVLGSNTNLPAPLSAQFLPVMMTIMDKVAPETSMTLWGEALNQRIGNHDGPYLDMDGIFGYIEPRNISFYDLVTIPEQDSWRYNVPGKGLIPSLVCDVYSMAIYKHAGVFDPFNVTFQYTEMTPKDAYLLTLYSNQWTKPKGCDPNESPYWCQISGKYYLELPGVATVQPYDNMFEKCGGNPDDNYYRSPHC